MLTVADVYAYVNGRAPFDTQMDFDNAGLLTGAMDQPVTGIHVALDCTEGVIQEAEHLGASLIVTHHPLMFHARKRMTEEDAEGTPGRAYQSGPGRRRHQRRAGGGVRFARYRGGGIPARG